MDVYEGYVTSRADPENLGRVKACIPGLIEPESPMWIWPVGVPGGGHAHRGHFEPPAVGANVLVMFVDGDLVRPRFLAGPWGSPGGSPDTPTNAGVDGDDRQNAVTEDAEWRIERDSRSATTGYRVVARGSQLAVELDGVGDVVRLARAAAAQAVIRGTAYQAAMAALLSALKTNIETAGTELGSAGVALEPISTAAATALGAAATALGTSGLTSASAYLSDKVYVP